MAGWDRVTVQSEWLGFQVDLIPLIPFSCHRRRGINWKREGHALFLERPPPLRQGRATTSGMSRRGCPFSQGPGGMCLETLIKQSCPKIARRPSPFLAPGRGKFKPGGHPLRPSAGRVLHLFSDSLRLEKERAKPSLLNFSLRAGDSRIFGGDVQKGLPFWQGLSGMCLEDSNRFPFPYKGRGQGIG